MVNALLNVLKELFCKMEFVSLQHLHVQVVLIGMEQLVSVAHLLAHLVNIGTELAV